MATPTKYGSEFLVNMITLNSQFSPIVRALPNGTFVVAWSDESGAGGDTFGVGIEAQLFNADGTKAGAEFLVNAITFQNQLTPDVVGLADGRLVATWISGDNFASTVETKARFLNADGDSSLPEFFVNSDGAVQSGPQIAVLADGSIVIVWAGNFSAGDSSGIRAQHFDSAGNEVGPAFQANTTLAGTQTQPSIEALADSGYIIAFTDFAALGGADVRARQFSTDGTPAGPDFIVSTTVGGGQSDPSIAALANGGFILTWTDFSGSDTDIRARIFPESGSPDADFLVNTTTAGSQFSPDIATLADGRFLIVWEDSSETGNDTSGKSIRAQLFTAAGAPDGEEFVVNAITNGDQYAPTVTSLADGRVVIGWVDGSQSPGDISDTAIRAQIFDPRIAAVNLLGTALGDDWVGTAFNDTMNGAAGNDQMDGGGGTDTAIFSAARAAYTIASVGNDFQVTGPDGTDLLKNFEFAQFADATVALVPAFTGTSGDDSFTALSGSQLINGLGGVDTITFDFALVDAVISWSGNRVIVEAASSHTELTGFETFVFTDGTVNNADGSPLVDDLFYYARNHDVWNAHIDAELHYGMSGRYEGRDPNAFFDISFYRAIYPDAGGTDPLAQFDLLGWQLGRAPSLDFDGAKYLAANPDVAAAHVDPLWHFLAVGASEGRQPFALTQLLTANGFDYVHYLQHNPDVAAAGVDPLQHFQAVGWTEGRNPNALFDTAGYLATYTDVAAAGINPFDHYNAAGWKEGRDPSVGFDTTDYLAANPDVAAAQVNPLLHFLQYGQFEGRSPQADGVWG
jgi:hypothetical protein